MSLSKSSRKRNKHRPRLTRHDMKNTTAIRTRRAAFEQLEERQLLAGADLRTVADAVTGLGDGYEGRILINGNPIDKYSCGKRGVTICGRNIGLYDHLTVAGNIAIPFKLLGSRARK